MVIDKSPTMQKYKEAMYDSVRLFMPYLTNEEIEPALDYSIQKRYKEEPCKVVNSYTNKTSNMTLLKVADYIQDREPIVTAYGTMFRKHGEVPNPLFDTVQSFLDSRDIYKGKMFTFPKGSEYYERYNLSQQLEKINANGCYGILGMFTSLIYNINVATSITSQGRASVATMTMFFEQFLNNNVKFGSINEVLQFIRNIKNERPKRKYKDEDVLDKNISPVDCFVKVVLSCGFRWIPDENELEIIWTAINNLSQPDLNRVYYKNNLLEFMDNESMIKAMRIILTTLERPMLNPNKPPEEIQPMLDELLEIIKEYVYYGYMVMDRIDKCTNMIRSVTLISDTDSTIVSFDGWYRFNLENVKDIDMPIRRVSEEAVYELKKDEFGDFVDERLSPIEYFDVDYDYDFFNDEMIELKHVMNPIEILPQDNVRHSIINILGYIATYLVNDYMKVYCRECNTYTSDDIRKCRIYAKNEFLFRRALMTLAMKSYATLQEVQEGHLVPKDEQLDIKGIASMAKSSTAESTRKELKKILYEDILNTPVIDQFKIIKHIAILEKKIINSLQEGSKEFYKPATVKSIKSYEDPMRIQGIKASVVWNELKDDTSPALDLDERNSVDIAKIKLDPGVCIRLEETNPALAAKARALLLQPEFKNNIDSVAIPHDTPVPEWVLDLLDYNTITNDNIGGFVFESVGIKRFGKNKLNYTNILEL